MGYKRSASSTACRYCTFFSPLCKTGIDRGFEAEVVHINPQFEQSLTSSRCTIGAFQHAGGAPCPLFITKRVASEGNLQRPPSSSRRRLLKVSTTWKRLYHRARNASESRNTTFEHGRLRRLTKPPLLHHRTPPGGFAARRISPCLLLDFERPLLPAIRRLCPLAPFWHRFCFAPQPSTGALWLNQPPLFPCFTCSSFAAERFASNTQLFTLPQVRARRRPLWTLWVTAHHWLTDKSALRPTGHG